MNKYTTFIQESTSRIVIEKFIFIIIIEFSILQFLVLFGGHFGTFEETIVDTFLLSLFSAPLFYIFIVKQFVNNEASVNKKMNRLSDMYSTNVIASNSDLNGVITYASKALCTISGYTEKELIGKPHSILRHPDTPSRIFEDMWKTIQQGHSWQGKYKNKTKDGNTYWVETIILPIYDMQKELIGYSSVRHDITAVVKVSEELDKQVAHAKHYQESLLEWTKIDFEDIDLALKEGVRISSDAMRVERVSIWSFDDDQKEMSCRIMYLRSEKKFVSGTVLTKADYPNYFNSIVEGNVLAIKNARTDEDTAEFTEAYLKPLDIHSMLDIPIIKEGKVVGVICYEATKEERQWSITEVEFASATANSIALSFEIDNRKKIEEKLSIQYNLIENIIDTVPVRIFWKSKEGTYLGANKLFLEDAQLNSRDKIIGKTDFELPWADTEAKAYVKDDLEVMKSEKSRLHFEESQTTKDGNELILSTSKSPLYDSNKNVIGVLGSYADITEQRTAQRLLEEQKNALYHQAHHDALTELPNRILFNDRLEHAIETANRNNTKVAVFFIDLDHFKEINDSLGHDIGDKVLKIVTSRLVEALRNEDTISRLGGDEFSIILEDLADVASMSNTAQKLLNELSEPMEVNNNTLYVSSSIGVSIYPDDGMDSTSLLKFADSAMYKAKNEGRNNFQFYNSRMTELALERVLMETNLRAAINNEEFVVHYQAQVNAKENQLIGMEALVRWQHPSEGLVSPIKFIPLAETTGLIVELDRIVMKIAMTQVSQWYKNGLNPGVLTMNLSVKQLQKKDCLVVFKGLLEETQCKPQWIELEVTESQIMKNPEEAIKKLEALSDLGIKLAVDDFGTGYSSLAYLKKLPISKLKIDQAFVRDLPDDEEDVAITKALIALAKSLNLKIIAEGVETKEQKDFLVENDCENIQGYYYSKPIPIDKFEEILKDGFINCKTSS